MFLLDTDVVSELRRRRGVCDPHVEAWASRQSMAQAFVSVITVAELEAGVRSLERRNPAQGVVIREWLEAQFMTEFADHILGIGVEEARIVGELNARRTMPAHDAFIAASALSRGLTVVTRNTRDFTDAGVPTVNPWLPVIP